jgi:hypothetical protein
MLYYSLFPLASSSLSHAGAHPHCDKHDLPSSAYYITFGRQSTAITCHGEKKTFAHPVRGTYNVYRYLHGATAQAGLSKITTYTLIISK